MRSLLLPAAAGLALLAAGCTREADGVRPFTGVLWEWDGFALRDYRARQWREGGVDQIFVRCATVAFSEGRVKSDAAEYEWQRPGSGLPVTLVIGLAGDGLPDALATDWRQAARDVAREVRLALERARGAGVAPRGVQLDLVNTRVSGGRYADLVQAVSRQLRSGLEVSATCPPALLDSLAAGQLARSTDYLVIRWRWPEDLETPEEAAAAPFTPSDLQRWSALAELLNRPFAVVLDPQPTYFECSGDPVRLTGVALRQLERQRHGLVAARPVAPRAGLAASKTTEFMLYRSREGFAPRKVLAAAPHCAGLRRLLKALPPPRRSGFLGVIVTVPRELPDELACTNEEIMLALKGRECLPEPQISLRPFDKDRNRVVARLDNVGCGRPALEPGSIRLRISYPSGVLTHAERSQFQTLEMFRTEDGKQYPVRDIRLSDTVVFSAPEMSQGALETGPLHLNVSPGARLRLTALLRSPGGSPGAAATLEVNLK